MPGDALSEYRRKRDFSRTAEPDGSATPPAEGPLRFMVHKHYARALHYDLRLELDGVMKSFAVPKGPSASTGEKRFATPTEDHPLSYSSFEGLIGSGQYGAGPSLIWDAGTFAPDEKIEPPFDDRELSEAEFRKGLENGKVGLTIRGKKLKGSWALVRMKTNNEWLLLKHKDAASDPGQELTEDGASVATGYTLDDLRAGAVADTMETDWSFSPAVVEGSRQAPLPRVEPMLASATPITPNVEWILEPKLDGIRVMVTIDHGEVVLRTRGGMDVTASYPGIVAALRQQPASTAVLDGEIVAITPEGAPSFELLQQRMNLHDPTQIAAAERAIPTVLYLFDVIYLDGYDLSKVALRDRKELLARLVLPLPQLQETFAIPAEPDEAFRLALDAGFEGIVAKRPDSRYEAGRRGATWLKRKGKDTETFVIGGFTAGTGHRGKSFGGLVIGEWVDGTLEYRGKVGSGFTDRDVRGLRAALDELVIPQSPFGAPTPDDRTATWVSPEIRIEIEYANRTAANVLRAPIFKGLTLAQPPKVSANSTPGPDPTPATADSHAVVEQIRSAKAKGMLNGPGWQLAVTNLDKVLWPDVSGPGHTKRDLLVYAATIWPWIERHIRNRPLTLLRFPNGIHDKKFYQKHWDSELPPFVETVDMYSDGEGGDQRFLLCNNLPTLLWLCQLADIEWHAHLARVTAGEDAGKLPQTFTGGTENLEKSVLNYPDFILFDLDPYIYAGHEKKGDEPQPNKAAFAQTSDVALSLKEILDSLSLSSFIKTSGATGLHIYVPIVRNLQYSVIRAAANTVCMELLSRRGKDVTMEWDTKKRTGKVFLDANQNARHKNLAVAYSPRAKPGAPVSMPLRWDEVGKVKAGDFTLDTVPALVAERGDAWAHILGAKQDLHKILGL
ncbi:MAG: non-homologous end-joining DNA ligase [Dehalococcoidia bacterium]